MESVEHVEVTSLTKLEQSVMSTGTPSLEQSASSQDSWHRLGTVNIDSGQSTSTQDSRHRLDRASTHGHSSGIYKKIHWLYASQTHQHLIVATPSLHSFKHFTVNKYLEDDCVVTVSRLLPFKFQGYGIPSNILPRIWDTVFKILVTFRDIGYLGKSMVRFASV